MFHVDVFLHSDVPPVRYLYQSVQRGHRQKRSVVLEVDGDPSTAVGLHVAIGTVGDLVSARRGGGHPGERLYGGGCQDDGGALGLDGVRREDIGIARKLHKLFLIL